MIRKIQQTMTNKLIIKPYHDRTKKTQSMNKKNLNETMA